VELVAPWKNQWKKESFPRSPMREPIGPTGGPCQPGGLCGVVGSGNEVYRGFVGLIGYPFKRERGNDGPIKNVLRIWWAANVI
jgi:hypothetical protein